MTEKMKFETKDLIQENIAKIGQLFPEVLTEAKDDNGILKKAIDFDKLRQILSDKAIDNRETYDFTWVGKKQAILEAATPIRKTLRPCKEESVNWDTTQNLYIEGDNLDVLKLLQDCYPSQVKMIYIDPPYNTGNDFIYRDDFAVSQKEYNESDGRVDECGNRLVKNTDSNGRFHSDWCSMMYPRLKLARNLLADDGVIFISIDDNEVDNLRKICDEVFGERNFIAQFNWMKTATPPSLSKTIRKKFEYILCFAKNKVGVALNGGTVEGGDMPLLNETNAYSSLEFPKDSIVFKIPDGKYVAGKYDRVTLEKDIEIYNGKAKSDVMLSGNFKWNQNTVSEEVKKGTIFRVKTKKFAIRYERLGERIKLPSNIISKDECNVGTNEDGQKEIKSLFDDKCVVDYPKPVTLMKYLVRMNTYEDDIVLDFFSGSATTAHAVMKLNAEDGGNRKFIMVQLPELTYTIDKNGKEIAKKGSEEAYKAGYKNICEIGKERIRRAAKQIKGEHPESNFDGGFRVFKLAESNMKEVYFSPSEYKQDLLSQMTSNIKEDRTDMDLLYGCMLERGLPLSYPHTSEKVGSYTIHNVNNGDLMACFDENIPEDIIRHMAAKKPRGVVFRDAGFADSPAKINVGELFKLLSPDTKVKVI